MKTLLVIDMQNDFINGALGTKEAEAILSFTNGTIASASFTASFSAASAAVSA